MRDYQKFYIDGAWVDPVTPRSHIVINPATEAACGLISLGGQSDVDRAVVAARKAFQTWSLTSREERVEVLERVLAAYHQRQGDMAEAITEEMGAPDSLSRLAQAGVPFAHFKTALDILKEYRFVDDRGATRITREPIGVCGFITPWNWPAALIVCKVAPALATGCTMVLKPSEMAPFSAVILAEILHDAGVPAGVFNLVNGDGPGVGAAIASHQGIDMVSFTGSTRAGIEVARAAAPTVKRVAQELGGKSPNIILQDANLEIAIAHGVNSLMRNSGQTCNAPSRMLVPHSRMEAAVHIAKAAAEAFTVGDPKGDAKMGPVVSKGQWDRIQDLIAKGVEEGATLVTGGLGRPDGLDQGYFVKPTVFANVTNDMTIAREEIFGPVLSILGYDTTEEAVEIANDTDFGLAAYVFGEDEDQLNRVASKLRAGQVFLNIPERDFTAPFGGYKMSGNGREWGDFAFLEFLEVKAILGRRPAAQSE